MPGTLSNQLVLSSTTLFPNPASVSLTATEIVSGSAQFEAISAPANTTTNLYLQTGATPVGSGTVYLFAYNSGSTRPTVTLSLTGSNTSASFLSTLRANDYMWIPLYVTSSGAVTVNIHNTTTTSSVLNVFVGERGN